MAADEFGIGVVGCGFITQHRHVPSIEYLPGARIAGLQNRTRETAERLAETCRSEGWGDPAVYGQDEVESLAHDPRVDGIWVAGPNFQRVETVEAIASAVTTGAELHGVAIEKPLARTVREGQVILEALDRAELPHAYLENWVFEPDITDLHELLWEGGRESGRPYLARAQAEHSGPHSGWFWDGRRQGGGALTDMLCHALAGNHVLLSDPEADGGLTVEAVTAETATLKWRREEYASQLADEFDVDYRESPADDYASVTVRYRDEAGRPVISEATGSWCYVGAGVRRSIELLGPEYSGRVESDESSSSVFFSDDVEGPAGWAEKQPATSGRMPIEAAPTVTGGYVAENRAAVEAFRTGDNGPLDLSFGQEILRLCLAAYKADETDEPVDPAEADLVDYVPVPARS